MPSFSESLGIKLINTGDEAGTWGISTNTNFGIFDIAIDGVIDVGIQSGETPLNTSDFDATSSGLRKVIRFTGNAGGTQLVRIQRNGLAEHIEKHYFAMNAIAPPTAPVGEPGAAIRFEQDGEGFTLENGYAAVICTDGYGNVRGATANLQSSNMRVLGNLLVKPNMADAGGANNKPWNGQMEDASARFECDLAVTGKITAGGGIDLPANSNLTVAGNLTVDGTSTLKGATTLNSTLTVAGATDLNGTLAVAGVLTAESGIQVPGTPLGGVIYVGPGGALAALTVGPAGTVLKMGVDSLPFWGAAGVQVGTSATGWANNEIPYVTSDQLQRTSMYWKDIPGSDPVTQGLGIGTANPLEKLHVKVQPGGKILVDDNVAGSGKGFRFSTNGIAKWDMSLSDLDDNFNWIGIDVVGEPPAVVFRHVFRIYRRSGDLIMGSVGADDSSYSVQIVNKPNPLVAGNPWQAPLLIRSFDPAGLNWNTVWQNSAGTVKALMRNDGYIYVSGSGLLGGFTAQGEPITGPLLTQIVDEVAAHPELRARLRELLR